MKATGIVRRIDDLGRVVIPKEIRRTLRLRDGDPMEIFTDREGTVILKKYSPIGDISDIAEEFAESAGRILGSTAVITKSSQYPAAPSAIFWKNRSVTVWPAFWKKRTVFSSQKAATSAG